MYEIYSIQNYLMYISQHYDADIGIIKLSIAIYLTILNSRGTFC